MAREFELHLPLQEDEIRRLRMGDIVYFTGLVHTLRDMGHRRAIQMIQDGHMDEIPFQTLKGGALWHCGPIVRRQEDGQWIVNSAGSTTSSRFSPLGAELIKQMNIRLTIGKGTMTGAAVDAMKMTGSVFLNTTGGCAALYAKKIQRVERVYWEDLGLPEACWVLYVERLGPMIVGIDSLGNSIFDTVRWTMKKNLQESYRKHNLKESYAYLPKRVIIGPSAKGDEEP